MGCVELPQKFALVLRCLKYFATLKIFGDIMITITVDVEVRKDVLLKVIFGHPISTYVGMK